MIRLKKGNKSRQKTGKYSDKHTGKETYRYSDTQTSKQTDRYLDTHKQANKQNDMLCKYPRLYILGWLTQYVY